MRIASSIMPSELGSDVYLVLDQLGLRLGRVWRETDEKDTDYATLIGITAEYRAGLDHISTGLSETDRLQRPPPTPSVPT